ncbi:MAG TPA: endonuclease/exonuclease/phosphatase family protein [Vicinamibacterales bacterium]|nr:endonuclease/exonuclease/phosphatase family protein [Vicinamibacterales bacterium]
MVVLAVLSFPGCARRTPPNVAPIATGSCRSTNLRWLAPSDGRERARLNRWCAGVGEAATVLRGSIGSDVVADMSDVVFVSWNVHVGSGDIRSFVRDLRAGMHTHGRRFPHYVLLLQEAVRTGDVPALAAGAAGAKRIAPHDPIQPIDIVRVSEELGASLVYVPSMRNGTSAADPAEDRGSAIVSTLPMHVPRAIELPGERQRRVVISAQIGTFSVAVVHLDALGGANRLRLFWTPRIRDLQVRTTMSALPDPNGPLVVGADLNTWHGRDEYAARGLAALFRATPLSIDRHGLGLRVLDYMFFRAGTNQRARYRQVEKRYGSDHRPLVGWVE